MLVRLSVESRATFLRDAPKSRFPFFAYVSNHQGAPVIHVEEGMVTDKRVAHELWHIVENVGNEGHHPWWHFCIAVFHPLRLWAHHKPKGRDVGKMARDLISSKDGAIDV